MVRQASEDVGEPGTRVDAVELRGFDQGVHGGSASPSGVGSVEGPVATAYRDGANGALGGVSRVPSYSLIETCVRLGVWVLGPPESNRRLSGHSRSCGADQAASKQAFRKTEKGRQRPVSSRPLCPGVLSEPDGPLSAIHAGSLSLASDKTEASRSTPGPALRMLCLNGATRPNEVWLCLTVHDQRSPSMGGVV